MLTDYLSAFDALAVTITDGSGSEEIFQHMPTDSPIWKTSKILALFHNEEEAMQAAGMLDNITASKLDYQIDTITDQDWVRETQKMFPAQAFGHSKNLWVIPSWEPQEQYHPPFVRIDPGVAFGTGTHPTTALCLDWLADHAPLDMSVIDYGCGSGILGLAALALKAKHVFATDHDEMAIEASNHNASLNNFVTQDNLTVSHYVPLGTEPADIVVANILANPLIDLAKSITSLCKSQGTLVLSGLLSSEATHVMQHYPDFDLVQQIDREDWCAVQLRKR